jgi:hypothetical protein
VYLINRQLSRLSDSWGMTPWEVIEQAMRWRKPGKDQKWLAEEVGTSAQAITNWKTRGVPTRQYRKLAQVFDLTVDQIEGLEPLPWAKQLSWPFSEELHARLSTLETKDLSQLEESIWTALDGREGRTRNQKGNRHVAGEKLTNVALDTAHAGGTVELIDPLVSKERSTNAIPRSSKSEPHGKHQAGRRGPARKA